MNVVEEAFSYISLTESTSFRIHRAALNAVNPIIMELSQTSL